MNSYFSYAHLIGMPVIGVLQDIGRICCIQNTWKVKNKCGEGGGDYMVIKKLLVLFLSCEWKPGMSYGKGIPPLQQLL